MVDTQVRPSDVTKFPIIDAMLSVPREKFVPDQQREAAYIGENIDIGGREVLEPRTVAKALDALNIQPKETVLNIACGLGYTTALLAQMAEFVVGLEDDDARVEEAQSTLSELGIDNAAVLSGELVEGAAKSGPYDVILIEGAVAMIPDSLLEQLKEGGRIAALFAEGEVGVVRIGYKNDGRMTWRDSFNAGADLLTGFEKKAEFQL